MFWARFPAIFPCFSGMCDQFRGPMPAAMGATMGVTLGHDAPKASLPPPEPVHTEGRGVT